MPIYRGNKKVEDILRPQWEVIDRGYWGNTLVYEREPVKYVAFSGNIALYSRDGTVWKRGLNIPGLPVSMVAYGNGIFVAVGTGGYLWSKNGIVWDRVPGMAQPGNSIAFAGGMFHGRRDANTVRYYSSDGINWTEFDFGLPDIRMAGI
jgi:hypothetical protein